MVRPRNQIIEISAETQKETWEKLHEKYSRRKLMQMLGAGAAATMAGCGGGGQETPTVTSTGEQTTTPGVAETTPTDTPAAEDEETPTPTETELDTPTERQAKTPTGEMTFTEEPWRDVTEANFEKFQPNPWNPDGFNNVHYQELFLACADQMFWKPNPVDFTQVSAEDWVKAVPILGGAEKFTLDPKNNVMTLKILDGLSWGDGTPADADNFLMHADIVGSIIEMGEAAEEIMPVSVEAIDDRKIRGQLLPGNPVLRWIDTARESRIMAMHQTHPKLHKPFIQDIRAATTLAARRKAIQKLFKATFDADKLPTMALGPFKPADWNPNEMVLEAREDFPWGGAYNPDLDRTFGSVLMKTIGERTNVINAALNGKKYWMCSIPTKSIRATRFPKDTWRFWRGLGAAVDGTLVFSPKSIWGKKNEKARKLRKGVAYLLDAEKIAAVEGHPTTYEQTTGMHHEFLFKSWLGEEFFEENFTNYGRRKTGFYFKDKGFEKFRQAGFARNKDGTWVDQSTGKPLGGTIIMNLFLDRGMTRPFHNTYVEHLRDQGLDVQGKFLEWEAYENRTVNNDFDLGIMRSNFAMGPHPINSFADDALLGTHEGFGSTYPGDYRNDHRRVEVPMPVGNPDGELTEFDWDKTVKEAKTIRDKEKMRNTVRTICWVLNQWVPGVATVFRSEWPAINKKKARLHDSYFNSNDGTGVWSSTYCEEQATHLAAGFIRPR